jgi:hypothetical protein
MTPSPTYHASVALLTRRALLKRLLATWAATCTIPWQMTLAGTEPTSGRQPAWLPRITGQRDAVLRLGGAYLETHPAEKDPEHLLASVDQALAASQGANSQPPQDIAQIIAALQRIVRDEYIRDQVTALQGWVVSRTEARLYALAAMRYSA